MKIPVPQIPNIHIPNRLKPDVYHCSDRGVLFCADARDYIRECNNDFSDGTIDGPVANVLITDPLWPGKKADLPNMDKAERIFSDVVEDIDDLVQRLIIILGVHTDPRLLKWIPETFPFIRSVRHERIPPDKRGPILYDADISYVYGKPWLSVPKSRLLPGLTKNPSKGCRDTGIKHPCPRNPKDMIFLAQWFTRPNHIILDPFAGSGTILAAAIRTGRRYIGVEISEEYCREAVEYRIKPTLSLQSLDLERITRPKGDLI